MAPSAVLGRRAGLELAFGALGGLRLRRRRDSRCHSGRSRDWIKMKNMAHPAIERAMQIAEQNGGRSPELILATRLPP